jgi:uncharacterized membrane protein YvbJ
MSKRKCKYCGDFVDERAVICTRCGTNQKSGRSFKAYDERSRKTFIQKLLIVIILAAFLFGCYCFVKHYRSQISELESGLVAKINRKIKRLEERHAVSENHLPKPADKAEPLKRGI